MGLSKADAAVQLRDTITKAGVEVTSHINSVINEQLTHNSLRVLIYTTYRR